MSLLIRSARPDDDTRIGELLVTAFETAYARKMPEVVYTDERRRELRDVATRRAEGAVLVAELEGEVVGTVSLYPPGAPRSEAWLPRAADLRQLAVTPGAFGKGYSAALLDAAEAQAWSWDAEWVCLHVRRGAVGVARLYQARGYARDPRGDLEYPSVSLEAYALRRPNPNRE